jgi:undecaprenyl-phosphate 4-deoxy-4-formamido-L-arabinose transferase
LEIKLHQSDKVSIIIPHFKSESINELVDKIESSLTGHLDYEIIIVDDSNSKDSWINLNEIHKKSLKVRCLELSKNYGQHNALLAGIGFARYDLIVTIDDDLQIYPDEIMLIYNYLNEKNLDLVYGTPKKISHNFGRKYASIFLKKFIKFILRVDLIEGVNSFRIFRKNLIKNFLYNSTGDISIDSMLFWSTGNYGTIEINHYKRKHGKSNYTFKKLLNLSIETILGYSTLPLRLSTYLGILVTLSGIMFLSFIFFISLISTNEPEGYFSTIATVTVFSGVQLISLGIIGEYLRKIHINSMRKPTFVIRNVLTRE